MDNYCSNCGKLLEPGVNFCSKCGKKLNQTQPINNQQSVYLQPPNMEVQNTKPDGLSTAGFVLGIISLFISLYGFIGLLALVLSCVGMAQTQKTDKKGRSRATTGIVLGIIGVVWGLYQIYLLYRWIS